MPHDLILYVEGAYLNVNVADVRYKHSFGDRFNKSYLGDGYSLKEFLRQSGNSVYNRRTYSIYIAAC